MRRTILADGRSLETAVRETLAAAKAAAAALPEADPARIAVDEAWLAWEQSNEFIRHGALVTAIGAQLGYGEAELDAMFTAAALIEA
jgi:acyl dehydratase